MNYPFLACLLAPLLGQAQWISQKSATTANFRAVCAVSKTTCWVGGSGGTVLRSTDGGETWESRPVPGAEKLDFRGVYAFDARTALLMSAGEASEGKAKIYRTTDGGNHWEVVFQTARKGVFLDGLAFWDARRGLCFGDPLDGKFYLLATHDGGRTWQEVPRAAFPTTLPGEAAFAASGTSLGVLPRSQQAWIGTGGGTHARVLHSRDRGQTWEAHATPLPAGPSAGIFGLRFWSEKNGLAVGGDYQAERDSAHNVLMTNDGGQTWHPGGPMRPGGLKESVVRLPNKTLLAVGPTGTGYSTNGGQTWQRLDTAAFHAVSFRGKTGWAVGAKGAIARWGGK